MAKKNAEKQNGKAKTKGSASKLRRTIMGTLSGIFLISALIVAAIPVKESVAADDQIATGIVFRDTYDADPDKWIPAYDDSTPVFYSSDALFAVAYVNRTTDYEGVVVYYDGDSTLAPTSLVIPETIDAYKYDNENRLRPIYKVTEGQFAFLEYISKEAEVDVSGNEIAAAEYSPCYNTNLSEWEGKQLYDEEHNPQDQIEVKVRYIGSKRYEPVITNGKIGGRFVTGTGVFEGSRNFGSLTVPSHILAIGNNAFKGCQMTAINVNTSIHSIGNYAFESCNLLSSVTFSSDATSADANPSNLEEIGAYAFSDCTNLVSISIPDQVKQIGRGCFMNCRNLSSANLYGSNQDGNTSLQYLGDGVFYNCTALQRIYLPNRLENIDDVKYLFYDCSNLTELGLSINAGTKDQIFKHTNVTGCGSLMLVTVPNRTQKFECSCIDQDGNGPDYHKEGDASDCTFGKANLGIHTAFPDEYEVNDQFYIKVYRNTPAYDYACDHEYAVNYLDVGYEDQFERVRGNYFYCVNDKNELIKFSARNAGADSSIVDIPDNIGVHYIVTIKNTTFRNNEDIEYVHIPASVTNIEAYSFENCTKLVEIDFADALTMDVIGAGAFKTNAPEGTDLRFVGVISPDSEPYQYAMTPGNNFNSPSSSTRYISYTSQFPTNLVVELRVEKDEITGEITKAIPTLVSAPTYEQFSDASSNSYSLSYYNRQREEQNAVVARAYAKYLQKKAGQDVTYFEDEQEVIDAVFRVVLPKGIYAMEDIYSGRDYITSAVLNSITEVPDGAFVGCKSLQSFVMRSSGVAGGERLGSGVFDDDDLLSTVILPETLSEIGSLPFYQCSLLQNVDFTGNPKFSCENAIIYENKADGTRKIVECLECRGNAVGSGRIREDELANVSELAPGAFKKCPWVSQVYFGDAPIDAIPESCFEGCSSLNYCEVSTQTRSIGDHAFKDTILTDIRVPANVLMISDNAFEQTQSDGSVLDHPIGMNMQVSVPSAAYEYALKHNIMTEDRIRFRYEVNFFDKDGKQIGETQYVYEGDAAVAPEPPEVPGWTFVGWRPADFTNISGNMNIYADYVHNSSLSDNTVYHTVTFYGADGIQKISVQRVPHGGNATAPSVNPEKDGYTFTGWLPEFTHVTTDLDVYPQFRQGVYNSNDPNGSGNGGSNNPNGGNGSGNGDGTGSGTDGGNGSGNGNGNGNGSNGSGSGGNGSGGSGSTVSGNGTYRPNSSNRGNTKVDVNKSGLSNTGLITATVNGSTDDFVVKITDSESARNAVEQALLNEYGSLENIRYFAMDISLYDRTGTTKIQNTDGITVNITMPIPDALRSYGGNNKAGAVVGNNNLQKLDAKFTTIDGVPCISFVATHFSPYTIYVDLNNLSASGMIDATPTTGDPIHPKWFLSIGLLLMSIMMFCMKGSKRTVVKVISG